MSSSWRIPGCLIIFSILWAPAPLFAQGTDPSAEPQPEFNFEGRPVAVIVGTTLFDDGTAQLNGVEVSNVPAPPYTADPPLLQISTFSDDGSLIATWQAWDPRWGFAVMDPFSEFRQSLSPAEGIFPIPLGLALTRVEIRDLSTDQVLLDVDVSTEVMDFCGANPGHVSCTLETFFMDGFETL